MKSPNFGPRGLWTSLLVENDTPEVKHKPKIYDKLPGLALRKQPSFQRLESKEDKSLKLKMSNLNLSKMSAYSNYSMFSNESNESLNVDQEKSSCQTMTESVESPCSSLNFSLKKSQSMISSSTSSSKDSSIGSVIAKDKSLQSFTQGTNHKPCRHVKITNEKWTIIGLKLAWSWLKIGLKWSKIGLKLA